MEEELKLPKCIKFTMPMIKDEERDYKVGDLRTIPKGTQIFSIKNQEPFILVYDVIVKINKIAIHCHFGFCTKMIRIGNAIIEHGSGDEWHLDISKTIPYVHSNFNFMMAYNYGK